MEFLKLKVQKLPRDMFFVKTCTLYDAYLFLEISENKNTECLTHAL